MDLQLPVRLTIFTLLMSLTIGCGSSDTPVTSTDPDMLDGLLDSEEDSEEPRRKSRRREEVPEESDDAEIAMTEDETNSEILDEEIERPAPKKSKASTKDRRSGKSTRTVSSSADRSGRQAKGDRLELRLNEGDRFPLIKTVEQTLVQKSSDTPAMAQTKLELTLVINVEQIKQDAILLGVRYSKVVYEHDVNGQNLLYDSSNHQGEVPWDAVPYAGMVNNGFSFWLGRDNKIREMVGYRDFLERCVANVPLERREILLSEISNRFGDDGVANFVDDSIGLLPYDDSVDPESATRVIPGDVWMRERTLMQPFPIHMKSTYRLTAMDDASAEIDITGRIAAGDAVGSDKRSRVRITGGHSLGRCVVDRATGLPKDMNLTRFMNLTILTPDQQEIAQEKQIITTIRAFPEMRGPVVKENSRNGVVPVSGQGTGKFAKPIPTGSAPGEPVEAVYPD